MCDAGMPCERPDCPWMAAYIRAHPMSPEEKEAQRRSFAYGNTHLSNPNITRETVDRAAERLKGEAE